LLTFPIFFLFPSKNQHEIKIVINDLEIQKVTTCKYLGVILDSELNWTEHIDSICKQLSQFIGVFYKLRRTLPSCVLKSIYFAFVHSRILYGIELYANTPASRIIKLVKLNNRILRILQNKPVRTNVMSLYRRYNTLPVELLHIQQLLIIAHKFYHHRHLLPDIFRNYFQLNNNIHCYNTRIKDHIHINSSNYYFGQKCLKNKIGSQWNLLPSCLKFFMSTNTFKHKLKKYLLLDNNCFNSLSH